MAVKLLNAPNIKKQPKDALNVKILIGAKAWEFAKAEQRTPEARNAAEMELDKTLPSEATAHREAGGGAIPPIVADEKVLANLTAYRLIPSTAKNITLQRANNGEKLPEQVITTLCKMLTEQSKANNISVQLYDEAMQLLEDLSGYCERIRQGDTQAELIQQKQAEAEAEHSPPPKTKPYFEEREENGIKGIFYIKPPRMRENGQQVDEIARWACSPLALKGEGYSESGEAFYIFEWQHPLTQKPHREAIPLSVFGKSAGWEMMQKYGLKMTNESYLNRLADHFHFNGDHSTKWAVTEKTGWKNGAYFLPNGEMIGEASPPVIFKNRDEGENAYTTKGTVESWQAEIGDNLRGNPFFMLAVATALASPLLTPLKAKSFGVHLFNDSSKGKTTALNIANSIYGNPEGLDQKWNQTPVAMMNNAQSRNDNFLTLDEIGQCKNFDDLEQTAYLLFNETGRTRGKKDGGNQQIAKWKITALSTGEIDLEGFLQAKGRNIQAGSLVRLLNIPMSEPQNLHRFTNAKAHADHLNEAVKAHFGTVGRAWINHILANSEAIKTAYKHYKTLWQGRIPQGADSQIFRVVDNFAILETALQQAQHLTQWTEEENREALIACFNNWLSVFGTRSKEETNIIESVNGWLSQKQHGGFIEVDLHYNVKSKPISGLVNGYRVDEGAESGLPEHFLVYPAIFNDVIKGKAKQVALNALANSGMLEKMLGGTNRPYQKKISRKLERNQPYCYVVYSLKEQDEG